MIDLAHRTWTRNHWGTWRPLCPVYPKSLHDASRHGQYKAKMPALSEFITARSTDSDCLDTFASSGRPNTGLNVDRDGVLVGDNTLHGGSHRFVPASLRARFLHPFHYFLLEGNHCKFQIYDCMKKETLLAAYVRRRLQHGTRLPLLCPELRTRQETKAD